MSATSCARRRLVRVVRLTNQSTKMIHDTKLGLIREALEEYLAVARQCILTDKGNGGCFGFPAALLLFCCIDAVGAYHRTRQGYTIKVDGVDEALDASKPSTYFYILNDPIFGLSLSRAQLNTLYSNYRSMLAHNAALKNGGFLSIGSPEDQPFQWAVDKATGQTLSMVCLTPLFNLVNSTVTKFIVEYGDKIESSVTAKGISSTGRATT